MAMVVVGLIWSVRNRTLELFIYFVIFFVFVWFVAQLPPEYQKQVEKPQGGMCFG